MSKADHSIPEALAPDAPDFGLTAIHLDEIARLADLASSYWRSIVLAGDRGDVLTVIVHTKQVIAVTKSAVAVIGELRADEEVS